MAMRDDVLSALDHSWRKARDVHARADIGAPVTVRNYLRQMALAGEIEEQRIPIPSGQVAVYRLKAS